MLVKSRTVLVEEEDIATSEVDGMRSAQAGHCSGSINAAKSAIVDATYSRRRRQ